VFSLFKKDPLKKLKSQYSQIIEQAMQAQRKGDIRLYSDLTSQAEGLLSQITELEGQENS